LDQCADRIVRQEVMCCLSSIIATLANGYDAIPNNKRELASLAEQAFELCSPIQDYEEAAREVGWIVRGKGSTCAPQEGGTYSHDDHGGVDLAEMGSWQNLCERFDIEPYKREVFEHWAVTQWLADKLREHGERVDDDFGDLCVWARTTTGQGIAMDGVIREIAKAIVAPAPSKPRSWADAIVRGVPSQAAWRAAIAPKT